MYISILGRQPELGMAELESIYGKTSWLNKGTALIDAKYVSLPRLGGSQKLGKLVFTLPSSDWHSLSNKVVRYYQDLWRNEPGKLTLGISVYDLKVSPREVQKLGITLKGTLKKQGVSLRLVPNVEPALSTATSHHNKLGLSSNKIELIIVGASSGEIVVAESIGSQNITAYAKRDQARPKRDAFVGMLPPKLAQIMINLAVGQLEGKRNLTSNTSRAADVTSISDPLQPKSDQTSGLLSDLERSRITNGGAEEGERGVVVLDPFCGTGVILQEAALQGYAVYGTDLSEKMIHYSRDNLNWLADSHRVTFDWYLHEGDAMTAKWRQPIDVVVAETYLGQPFSAPPSDSKLEEVLGNCNHIIIEFLRNIGGQVQPGTPFCLAVPAWRQKDGTFAHLPIVDTLGKYGYKPTELKNVSKNDLLYYREDQVVARELLIFTKA